MHYNFRGQSESAKERRANEEKDGGLKRRREREREDDRWLV